MPLLDVSDLVDDPDFTDDTGTLQLVRTTRTPARHGRTTDTSETMPLEGVVMPASDTMLKLLPEGARVEGAIVVYTRERLYALTANRQPDQVLHQDRTYIVTAVADWTPYGAGFCAAVCTLKGFVEASV